MSMAAESEQLRGVVRSAAMSHEEQYYALRMARYPDASAENMRCRQIEQEHSTAWALAKNEAAARGPLNLPYNPASLDVEGCRCVVSCDGDRFNSDFLMHMLQSTCR